MIVFENETYRIYKYVGFPSVSFALDRKERDGKWLHLHTIGWYDTYDEAMDALRNQPPFSQDYDHDN